MMDEKKYSVVPQQKEIEELSDAQLDQVNGGIEIPTLPSGEKPGGLKLGQALKKNTSFTKSDDQPAIKDGD